MVYAQTLQETETHNILKDSEIQTDPLFPTRRRDLVLIKKNEICRLIKESKTLDKYQRTKH